MSLTTPASNRALAVAAITPMALLVLQAELGPIVGLALLASFVVPPILIARRHGGLATGLGLRTPTPRALAGAVLLGLSLWIFVVAILAPVIEALPDHAETEAALAPLTDPELSLASRLLLFAALPAFIEELLCRGLLCRHLAAGLGRAAGLGISALYFAALHLSLSQGLPALVTGLITGALVLGTGSTWTAIGYHAANNAAIVLVAAPELVLGETLEQSPLGFLGGGLAAVLLGLLLLRRNRGSAKSLQ